MASPKLLLATLGLATIIFLPTAAPGQIRTPGGGVVRPMAPQPSSGNVEGGKVFGCDGGRELRARFATHETGLVAIVDLGEGPVELPLRPYEGGAPKITWSDGARTLVWSTGVRLMYTDGSLHLMCGRAAGEAHH